LDQLDVVSGLLTFVEIARADAIIAKQIVELARAGERHPDILCEGVLKTLRGHLFGD
jgi:hypothetical protein